MILDFLSFINESSENTIRVSCAGLASINIDGKYLLVQNKKSRSRGIINYGPLGGALEFLPEGEEFLNSINAILERETPDLRFVINTEFLDEFVEWFYKTDDREKSTKREVFEELVLEEKVLTDLELSDMKEEHIDSIRNKSGRFGVVSERMFEIFEISFQTKHMNIISNQIRNQITNILYNEVRNQIDVHVYIEARDRLSVQAYNEVRNNNFAFANPCVASGSPGLRANTFSKDVIAP